jgi:hypothetical protein
MLVEIFLIRVEAILRSSREMAAAIGPRFVPITLPLGRLSAPKPH